MNESEKICKIARDFYTNDIRFRSEIEGIFKSMKIKDFNELEELNSWYEQKLDALHEEITWLYIKGGNPKKIEELERNLNRIDYACNYKKQFANKFYDYLEIWKQEESTRGEKVREVLALNDLII